MKKIQNDILGIILSVICAVHCLVLPIFIGIMGINLTNGHLHWLFDLSFLFAGGLLIYFSVYKNYRLSGNIRPLQFVIMGVFFFMSAFVVSSTAGHILFALGGMSWAFAHLSNFRLHRSAAG